MSVWILDIAALNGADVAVTLRFADGAYVDGSANYYEPRMIQPAIINVSPDDGGVLSIFKQASIGEIELANVDGGLNYLVDYAVDGRAANISLVDGGVVTVYFYGTIERMTERGASIFLTLKSLTEALGKPHPAGTYAGNNSPPNGLEGTTDTIFGNQKPKVFGTCKNLTPVMVNSSILIYQASSLTDCTITAVYDDGVTLTQGSAPTYTSLAHLQSTAPTGGWRSYQGYVRLAASPSKLITCDANTSASGAGSVFSAIAADVSPAVTVDSASVTALNTVGTMGIFKPDGASSKELFDKIARSVGGFYYYIATTLYFSLINAPATSIATINEWQIVSIEREATGLGANGLPIAVIKMQYDKMETVQTVVAGATALNRIETLKTPYRVTIGTDTAAATRHPLYDTLEIESGLRIKADADAVVLRLLNLAKIRRDVVNVTAYFSQMPSFNLGNTVTIKHTRLGYSAGRDMVIIGYERDIKRKRITLRLFG